MSDSPQMTQQINDAVGGNPISFIKALVDIAQSNNEQLKAASGLESQNKTQDVQNAYQKGVNKALSEHGYKHGSDAIAAGVDPNDIANHETMQPSINMAPQNQDGKAALISLLNTSQSQSPNQVMSPTPDGGVIGKLLKAVGFGMTPEMMNSVANYSATKQRVDAGQPSDIAVPLAQAAEMNQKIAGAVPLQPADIIKLNVDTYSAALKANQDAYANSNAEVANLTKTLDILQQGRSTFGKAIGGSSDIMNSLKQVIAAKTLENQKIGKNQKMLIDNAPKVGSNNTDLNKVGKYSFTKG